MARMAEKLAPLGPKRSHFPPGGVFVNFARNALVDKDLSPEKLRNFVGTWGLMSNGQKAWVSGCAQIVY
jgi:hypothetical protein